MAFKLIALAALVAVAQAGVVQTGFGYNAPLAYAAAPAYAPIAAAPAYAPIAAAPAYAPIAAKAIVAKQIDYDAHPQYSYAYDVNDPHTGDSKTQQETRDGDVVRGSYSLLEADGTRRIVEYTADAHNGFNAIVRKEGTPILTKTIAAAPVITKTFAAPIVSKTIAAPLAYAPAPVLTKTYAAPLAYAPAPIAKYHAAPALAAYQAAPVAYPAHQGYY